MEARQVINCTFSRWYDTFSSVTTKSLVIPLPQDVVRYLLADGIVLPEGSNHGCNKTDDNSDDEDSDVNWDDNVTSGRTATVPIFTAEFTNRVESALKKLGGTVFPKLNWSSPKDAAWVATGNTLKCQSLGDILLLLKSSDFVTHDLTAPYEKCVDAGDQNEAVSYELVLRKWVDIPQSGEFRCFIKDERIIAISQRYYMIFFPFIFEDRTAIISDIVKFHRTKIFGRFGDDSYIIDVYRRDNGSVRLLDFNPYGERTDPLMFSWNELCELGNKSVTDTDDIFKPEFRCLERETGVQPNEYHPYAVPKDFVDLSRGEDPFKLIDLMKLKEAEYSDSSSDDDE